MVLANSNGCAAAADRATSSQPEESHSVINFKTGYNNFTSNSGCFLSFGQNPPKSRPKIQQQSGCSIWEDDDPIHSYQSQLHPKCTTSGSPLFQEFKCVDQSDNTFGEEPLGGSDSEAEANAIFTTGMSQEFGTRETCFNKRPNSGESIQPLKKRCTINATEEPKSKSTHPSKDPQSMAAKNRRQRITERIKTLQELVPNGSKVDLVTMLEKAISYVKFLQLQVKVLATDEFWPVRGRKAPDLSQVKEAIDSILSSNKDRNSTS